jgi:hypothetical protein
LATRSPWVLELTQHERSLREAILLLAGGREFLAGKGVQLQRNGMAPRTARYLKDKSGRTPSDTSLDEAVATAALEMVKQVAVWEYVLGIDTLPASRLLDDECLRSHVCA